MHVQCEYYPHLGCPHTTDPATAPGWLIVPGIIAYCPTHHPMTDRSNPYLTWPTHALKYARELWDHPVDVHADGEERISTQTPLTGLLRDHLVGASACKADSWYPEWAYVYDSTIDWETLTNHADDFVVDHEFLTQCGAPAWPHILTAINILQAAGHQPILSMTLAVDHEARVLATPMMLTLEELPERRDLDPVVAALARSATTPWRAEPGREYDGPPTSTPTEPTVTRWHLCTW